MRSPSSPASTGKQARDTKMFRCYGIATKIENKFHVVAVATSLRNASHSNSNHLHIIISHWSLPDAVNQKRLPRDDVTRNPLSAARPISYRNKRMSNLHFERKRKEIGLCDVEGKLIESTRVISGRNGENSCFVVLRKPQSLARLAFQL